MRTLLRVWAAALLPALLAPASWQADEPNNRRPANRPRRPVAAALIGNTLYIANRCGTISALRPSSGDVLGEVAVGQSLSDLVALPDRKHLLVTDEAAHELIALAADGPRLTVRARLAVAPYPVSVVPLAGGRAAVAGLWSRQLDVIDVAPATEPGEHVTPRRLHTVPLPFAPRLLSPLPGNSLVAVADAFGGRLAVIDAATGKQVARHEWPGHNVRGLATGPGGKELLIAHQVLDTKAPVTRENIRVGVLMANVLRQVPLDEVTSPARKGEAFGTATPLDSIGLGAGDPAGVAVTADGQIAVALGGVDQVLLYSPAGGARRRVDVGRRPTRLLPLPGGQLAALNTLDDSVTVLDPRTGDVVRTVELGPEPRLGPADRGERHFYDARLSFQGWLSCHSCHPDGHTNGLNADTLSDGTHGTPKRTLTLLGTRLTDPWGWNGSARYLRDQVEKSLADTLHAPAAGPELVADLTSFVAALPPPPPFEPARGEADRARIERGRAVFEARGCTDCHVPPLTYSTHSLHDVGFTDEAGLSLFNPPSLRGVGHGSRFLHDGRAASLEEVFTRYRHKTAGIDPNDLADLLRFLRSL